MEKKYDFPAMEDRISIAYSSFCSNSTKGPVSETVKTELYTSIKVLTDAIVLDKSLNKMKMDNEEISYNYAVDLYERLVTGALRPKDKKGYLVTHLELFPWNSYIRKSIKRTIENMGEDTLWSELITELDAVPSEEYLKDRSCENWEDEQDSMNANIDHDRLSVKLYKYMQAHYTDKDINRLWPLASELIYRDGDKPLPDNIPDYIANFLRIYMGGARRLARQYNVRVSFDEMSLENFNKAKLLNFQKTTNN